MQTAEQIEHNGAAFYRKAAEILAGSEVTGLLRSLAEWEEVHEKTFSQMRKEYTAELGERREVDAEHFESADPRVVQRFAGSVIRAEEAGELTGREGRAEILTKAVELERLSIAFYEEVKRAVGNPPVRSMVNKIIAEEKNHVKILQQSMKGG